MAIWFELQEGETFDLAMQSPESTDFGCDEYVEVLNIPIPYYDGPYIVTPSRQEQVLRTEQMAMSHDVTIAPIPKNYGLVTWNGSVLRVS